MSWVAVHAEQVRPRPERSLQLRWDRVVRTAGGAVAVGRGRLPSAGR
jgi:hypothetical protein